jgi:tetratricopeptide (TPR) repeat protein
MAAVLRDAYGLPVSSSSRPAVDAYDRGVRALLGFGADAVDCFRRALEADQDFVLARAALGVSLYLDEQLAEGRATMNAAFAAAAGLPPRERRHAEALALWVAGRGHEATGLMKEILAEHPRDMMVLQRLYYIHFWQGRSAEMLDTTRSVLHAFDSDSYILGLHAFSLEENRHFEDALALAERAIAINPKDAWAVHAVAHVLYERGENDRGAEALPPRIHPCDHLGYFRNHLLWHLALMHLAEGRYERAHRLFQSVFERIPITVGSDLQDSVSLAWRLDLFGHPEPARWARLGPSARRWLEIPLLLFHDLHVGMALAASGDWASAEEQLSRLRGRAKRTRNATLPEVVMPLLEGLHAFARGEHAEAAARIAPIESRIREVGGSHAQREVFHDTLLAAALRAGLHEQAAALLERRLAKRPNPGHYWTTVRLPGAGARSDGGAPA